MQLKLRFEAGNHDDSPLLPLTYLHSSTYLPPSVSLLWAPLQPQFLHISAFTHLSDARLSFPFTKRKETCVEVVDRVFLYSSLHHHHHHSHHLRSFLRLAPVKPHGRSSRGEPHRVMLCYVLVSGLSYSIAASGGRPVRRMSYVRSREGANAGRSVRV